MAGIVGIDGCDLGSEDVIGGEGFSARLGMEVAPPRRTYDTHSQDPVPACFVPTSGRASRCDASNACPL